jgi:hypothetical protein
VNGGSKNEFVDPGPDIPDNQPVLLSQLMERPMLLNILTPVATKLSIEDCVKAAVPKLCNLIKTVENVEFTFQSGKNKTGFSVDLTVLTVHEEIANTSITFEVLMNIILEALQNPHEIHTFKFVPGPTGWNDFQCFITRHEERSPYVRLQFPGKEDTHHRNPRYPTE